MSKYLMAIDAGTGSVRAVLFDLEGHQIGASQQEWTHLEDPRYPGSMDFDIEANITLVITCIKTVIEDTRINSEDILAVSTTSMREGFVLYDQDGKEIWACANVDSRAKEEVSELKNMGEKNENIIYKLSGQTYALGALPRLLWLKNHRPDLYQEAKTLTMLNDWLIYRLSGVLSAEPSNGCTTGIFDLKKRTWHTDIAKICQLKEDIFPVVYESGHIVGSISDVFSQASGLSTKTLVITGGGDAQLGAVGVGVVSDKQAAVFGGSFWQYEFNTQELIMDSQCRVRVNCHAVPHIWQYEAIAFFPGLVTRWYRDAFCQTEKETARKMGVSAYSLMEQKASEIPPGCYDMMCAFSDIMNYISWKHASPTFTNFQLDPEKYNRYTFYRSILENAALVTKGHVDLVHEVTGHYPDEIIFAGGSSNSPLWCQILADVLNLPIKVPKVKEATALGAAMCAGVGCGVYESLESASKALVSWDKIYTPNPDNQETYQRLYKKWCEMYKHQLTIADKGITQHMWKAPGL